MDETAFWSMTAIIWFVLLCVALVLIRAGMYRRAGSLLLGGGIGGIVSIVSHIAAFSH